MGYRKFECRGNPNPVEEKNSIHEPWKYFEIED